MSHNECVSPYPHDCDLTTTPPSSLLSLRLYFQLNKCVRDFSRKGSNSGGEGTSNYGGAGTLTCGLNCSACASHTECTHSRAGCMMEVFELHKVNGFIFYYDKLNMIYDI